MEIPRDEREEYVLLGPLRKAGRPRIRQEHGTPGPA